MTLMQGSKHLGQAVIAVFTSLSPLVDLLIRIYIAQIFWQAGINKFQSWDSTLLLFQYEYQVPLLAPVVAAYIGTAIELVMPLLLVLGLGTRFAALILFVFNFVAVLSYPGLNAAGIDDHKVWGLLLLVTVVHGAGALSLDHWLKKKYAINNLLNE